MSNFYTKVRSVNKQIKENQKNMTEIDNIFSALNQKKDEMYKLIPKDIKLIDIIKYYNPTTLETDSFNISFEVCKLVIQGTNQPYIFRKVDKDSYMIQICIYKENTMILTLELKKDAESTYIYNSQEIYNFDEYAIQALKNYFSLEKK